MAGGQSREARKILRKSKIKNRGVAQLVARLLWVTKATAAGGRCREPEEAQQNRAQGVPLGAAWATFCKRADKAEQ